MMLSPCICFSISGYSMMFFFFFSSRRRHTRCYRDWSSDVCSSDLERPDLVLDVLQRVGDHDRPDRARDERHVELEAAAFGGTLIDAVLREQEHAERLESHVAERELVALVVLAEAACPAGAGGHVDVLLRDLLGADALRLGAEEVGEVPGREARRTALADVGHLAPGEKILLGRGRQDLRVVAEALHRA